MDNSKPEDPRAKSNRYSKGARAKFDKDQFDFQYTQFLIDDNYVGEPPQVQVSIDNLNDNIDENFLTKELTKLGRIRTLEIVRHPKTNQHLGLAKVQFEEVSVAQACVENFRGKHIMGRQLNVFKDLRFAIIEGLKEEKLNPRPAPPPPVTVPAIQNSIIPNAGHHHPHPSQLPLPIMAPSIHHAHLQGKTNSMLPTPSPLSSDYPITTPGSIGSLTATPDSNNRGRLDDRIAMLLKQSSCPLSAIVAPAIAQAAPTFNSFSLNEKSAHDYTNSSYYHPANASHLKMMDKQRASDHNDHHMRPENSAHGNHYQNHRDPYHQYDANKVNIKQEHFQDHNSDDDWNKMPEKVKEPLNLELTEDQIKDEVLPYCYEEFYKELSQNLLTTIFKKLRENYGYQCLEKAQQAYRANQERTRIERDKERHRIECQKELERRYMAKSRVERPVEAPRPRVTVIRQRTTDYNTVQETKRRGGETDLRRVNRSSAYVAEPERRGSHNTSIDSEFSDDDDSSASSFDSSPPSSRSSSRDRSRSTSRSRSSSTSSSKSSYSSEDSFDHHIRDQRKDVLSKKQDKVHEKSEIGITSAHSAANLDSTNEVAPSEQIAISALLSMNVVETGDNKQGPAFKESKSTPQLVEEDDDEIVKRPPKIAAKKRKKTSPANVIGVASEYRAAKRFASDPSGSLGSYDEDIENAMIDDENYLEEKPEARFVFNIRPEDERQRMLEDLSGTMTDEDVKYLMRVHADEVGKNISDVEIPFGSEYANKAHLNLRKHMIDGKAAESHPKWWRGCSRCDVIEVSEKEKADIEEMNYEDLTMAPIKSHVIQAANTNSSRRDLRGDQRRIAVLNPDIDREMMKLYTTNTLQMRAKNLRFSRSKIHKWGLFACEKIASGDAVIEYVGEKIRPSLADHREKIVYTNLPTHDGSSYFFRVDTDVIDATLKGNKARFINHSCNPNCIAKVIKHDNGTNSIVIYAKQPIQEDEEITYDYKFPREESDQKIQCNCKAPNCQKFLN